MPLLSNLNPLLIGLACFLLSIHSEAAEQFQLDLPVQCEMGKECFIQNYFDHQSGSEYKDYRCGHLTYDNHSGTDFRVVDEQSMNRGVLVLAAASGRVLGVRDGEPDIPVSVRGNDKVAAKQAGNGVVLDHGNGWHTQYSHLKNGSLLLKQGEWVERGQPIGQIGESGNADFPHVDFSVRKNGKAIDPFWPSDTWSCDSKDPPAGLWSLAATKSLSYVETAILHVGFSEKAPSRLEAQSGSWGKIRFLANTPQLVLWAEVMGANAGDRWRIEVYAPNGQKFIDSTGDVAGDKAVIVVGAGKSLKSGYWPAGTYQGVFALMRAGKVLSTYRVAALIEPML